jgi:hypothetical protein
MKRISCIILVVVALFAGTAYGHAQETEVATDGNPEHDHFYEFDTTAVWHPQRILILWYEMELDILLPRENKHSGVANLLLRDRSTGEIRLLDSVKNNPTYGEMVLGDQMMRDELPDGILPKPVYVLDSIKHIRYANRFEPGRYDAILLYNNGRYITCENISFEKGMQKVVDMTKLRPHKADKKSRKWLQMRKFTDVVGQRWLRKYYPGTSPHKIIGYLFFPSGDPANKDLLCGVSIINNERESKQAEYSGDGYFELDVDNDSETYPLEFFITRTRIYASAKANTWIFAVRKRSNDNPILTGVQRLNE